MSNDYELTFDADLPDLGKSPEKIVRFATMAINKTVDRARTLSAERITQQVNFPASYLRGTDSRLAVTKRASSNNLEGVVTGRYRATSLARFVHDNNPAAARKRGGLTIEVKPGKARFVKGAFLVKLRAGATKTDTKYNLGVAIRLKQGQRPRNSRAAVQLDHNVWLLYGPSVQQVFQSVREDVAPEAQDFLVAEFLRLLNVEGL